MAGRLLIGAILWSFVWTSTQADIGPENTILVVNPASADSVRIADHYARRRGIADVNRIELVGVPDKRRINVATFKSLILAPLLSEITGRGLGRQARLVAYSAGFPTEIDIREHQSKLDDANLRKLFTPVASLPGATFHFLPILGDQPNYLQPGSNFYARGPMQRSFVNPFATDPEAFGQAKADQDAGRYAEAAAGFHDLIRRDPAQHPIALLAARSAAAAKLPDQATLDLLAAAKMGWWSRGYVEVDNDLAPLLTRPGVGEVIANLPDGVTDWQPPVGFVGHRVWTPSGVPTDTGEGYNYLLSACLAVTGPGAMTADEAIAQLDRSIDADGSQPTGKFVFCQTGDVRTTTRLPGFATAIKALALAGYRAEIVTGSVPQLTADIAGLMIGTPRFDWAASGSTLTPGAIAENLTSFGGVVDQKGQTTLFELLRGGAALSSGTVTEPYAVQFKFPHPMMHLAYTAGLTAIEAMTGQVQSPYQLLIVGDPLCNPYKSAIDMDVTAVSTDNQSVKISIDVQSGHGHKWREMEVYFNGSLRHLHPIPRSVHSKRGVEHIELNLTGLEDNRGTVRVVLVGTDLVQSRFGQTTGVIAAN